MKIFNEKYDEKNVRFIIDYTIKLILIIRTIL